MQKREANREGTGHRQSTGQKPSMSLGDYHKKRDREVAMHAENKRIGKQKEGEEYIAKLRKSAEEMKSIEPWLKTLGKSDNSDHEDHLLIRIGKQTQLTERWLSASLPLEIDKKIQGENFEVNKNMSELKKYKDQNNHNSAMQAFRNIDEAQKRIAQYLDQILH